MTYRIKEHRLQAGLSQAQLAEQAGISRATISSLENGAIHATTTRTLQKLAAALGCKVGDLYGEDGPIVTPQNGTTCLHVRDEAN